MGLPPVANLDAVPDRNSHRGLVIVNDGIGGTETVPAPAGSMQEIDGTGFSIDIIRLRLIREGGSGGAGKNERRFTAVGGRIDDVERNAA